MEKKKTGLGKGLDALFNSDPFDTESGKIDESRGAAMMLDVHKIDTNAMQPRREFDEEKLNELAESIKQHGVVQPIIVTRKGDRYMIVAGERRFRASRIAGLTEVPVLVREMAEEEVFEIALIENIQREDLNPVEEAAAIRYLMQQQELTQEQAAQKLGKSRAAIANSLRLLNLPDSIHQMIRNGELQMGHAKVLMGVKEEMQEKLARQAADEGWSVRTLESKAAGSSAHAQKPKRRKKDDARDPVIVDVEGEMRAFLGTKVQIAGDENRGKIIIDYYSRDTLEGIYDLICQEHTAL